ncbi:MAG: N-acetylmuramoyl-L-alanine amidase [Myxococcales bacterium]|nr:N-acetylmuramoyl-L-alanine amidase [Myxococcales bacterium]
MGFTNVGEVWTPDEFRDYLGTIDPPAWARAITLHHTGSPDLAARPDGFSAQLVENMRHYYADTEVYNSAGTLVKGKWSAGPHLFIDDDQCWGMTALDEKGVHAGSFNAYAIGMEVLGYYDEGKDDPFAGRGGNCWDTAFKISAALLEWMGLAVDSSTVLFHRDEPNAGKTCPGTRVLKTWAIEKIIMVNAGKHLPPAPPMRRGGYQVY